MKQKYLLIIQKGNAISILILAMEIAILNNYFANFS